MKRFSTHRIPFPRILLALGAASTACAAANRPSSGPSAPTAAPNTEAQPSGGTGPTAEQKRVVDAFLGQWVYHSTITPPGSAPIRADLSMSCDKTAGGRAVVCALDGEIPGVGTMDAGILVGVDRLDGKVHFMAMTSDDELHDHVCAWQDEKNLLCAPFQGGLGGQPIREDLSFAFDGDRGSFHSVIHQADGTKVVFDAPGSKVSALPARGPSAGKAPEPLAEQKKIVETFLGRWTLAGDIKFPNEQRASAALDLQCRTTAAGKAALCMLSAEDIAGRPYEAAILVGHDPFDKAPHFMMMSSDDEVWHRTCAWKSETVLDCGPMRTGVMGMPVTSEIAFDFAGAKGSTRWLTDLGDGKTCLLTAQMSR